MTNSAVLWSVATPLLILVWLLQRLPGLRGRRGLLVASALAAGAVYFGWSGHSLPFWSASLSANLSVVMALLFLAGIHQRAGGAAIFRAREWRAAWGFGACASLLLYPSAFGLGWQSFDSYSLGWPWLDLWWSLLLFATVAAVAGFLVWRGNRFGWVLVVASICYISRIQESQNVWDYLLDPLYAAVSLLMALWWAVSRLRRR